ncbi:MAG: hypothetical protein IJ038_00940 [Clostridia bacterium]|nr:hypothetical protein [Clostridia bacterium]
MNGDDKIRGADIKPQSNFLRRVENFWYHYKWTTIIVLFFVLVFVVCTVQMCSNEKEDIAVLYAGPVQMSAEEMSNFESVMNFVMPEDFDKNGKKDTKSVGYQIYSEEQIKNIESQTDAAGVAGYVDRSYNSGNYDNFYNYIQTGDCSICFVDPSLFENMRAHDRLMKLSDVLGYSDGSIDGYGYRLGDLEIYDSYGALQVMPEDTVVCLLRPLVVGKSSDAEAYGFEKSMFKAIIEFENAE